jgi:putative flippase GtrA
MTLRPEGDLLRFLIVGVFNTVMGMALILLLYHGIGLDYRIANVTTYTIGLIITFMLHKQWVFKSRADPITEVTPFLAVFGTAFLVNFVLVSLVVEVIGWHPDLGQLAGISGFTLTNYLGQKYLTFRKGSRMRLQ